ncbi:uncharacterized protein LOC126838977 isoform X2 [Adelges cooleyi]|uniref:uncharacterized protein LOC126838977 isoform X1 n=2 Tax=Adelges cooleyi TaxID=133065 RepID=UPI00217F8A60|nr:uncharacterized protein LOC126838977 isoform X1 [Adelges cooleyi]XP_050429784.1 uncharacterized protein LOC126838977 isoform X2 [Adelges cooleyi]
MDFVYVTTHYMKIASEKNDLTLDDGVEANALECLIEAMVDDINDDLNYQDFRKINFLIAVPEKRALIENSEEEANLITIQRANRFLEIMLDDIKAITKITIEAYGRCTDELISFTNKRRKIVFKALQSIIRRRLLGSVQAVENNASLLRKCRLLGLYLSSQDSQSYIKEIQINTTTRTCILTDKNEAIKMYRTDDAESLERLLRLERQRAPSVPRASFEMSWAARR